MINGKEKAENIRNQLQQRESTAAQHPDAYSHLLSSGCMISLVPIFPHRVERLSNIIAAIKTMITYLAIGYPPTPE